MNTITKSASTNVIVGVDRGKYKSGACVLASLCNPFGVGTVSSVARPGCAKRDPGLWSSTPGGVRKELNLLDS